jgi:hypothetical protein
MPFGLGHVWHVSAPTIVSWFVRRGFVRMPSCL